MNIYIAMPYYNREQFIPLIKHNINKQSYTKTLMTLIMDDDSDIKLSIETIQNLKDSISPCKLIYLSSQRKTIGKKRNDICKYIFKNYGKHAIVVNMDTDDLYNKDYIKYGVELISNNKYNLIGASDMLFTYPKHDYSMSYMRTGNKLCIHEASMIYTIKLWKHSNKYNEDLNGEGKQLIQGIPDSFIYDCPIQKCLVCIAHENNTINKDIFYNDNLKIGFKMDNYDREIISKCI